MKPNFQSSSIALIIYASIVIALYYLSSNIAYVLVIGAPFLAYFPGMIISNRFHILDPSPIILPIGLSIIITGSTYTLINIVLGSNAPLALILIMSAIAVIDSLFRGSSFYRYPYFSRSLILLTKTHGKERMVWAIAIVFLLIATSSTIYFISTQNDVRPFSEIYIISMDGKAFDYNTTIEQGSNFSLKVGISNHEGRTVHYQILCFLVNVTSINQTNIEPSMMRYLGAKETTLDSDAPDIDSEWGGQWESKWSFSFSDDGKFKLFFFLFEDGLPDYVSDLTVGNDYQETAVATLLMDTMHSNILNVNLNVEINPPL